jgi:ubiquitin-protein ligase
MASLNARAMKRLAKDLKGLMKEPLVGANARPKGEDMSLWNATILCPLSHPKRGTINVPLHFLIDFPSDYPASAPSVGFSVKFPYHTGASYVINDKEKRLNGLFVLCLDILGNFAHVHTEWKDNEGSGWSTAYTVSTLLIQLQSLIIGIDADLSESERKTLFELCSKFAEDNPDKIVPVLSLKDIKSQQTKEKEEKEMKKFQSKMDPTWFQFAVQTGLTKDSVNMSRLVDLIADTQRQAASSVIAAAQSAAIKYGVVNTFTANTNGVTKASQGETKTSLVETVKHEEPEIDENICCYVTGASYADEILGFGISESRRGRNVNLSTPCELLSADAFLGGCRQSTRKAPFQYFMPAFINEKHGGNNLKWRALLKKNTTLIGKKCYSKNTFSESAVIVFPRLMNTLLVEMMHPDVQKSAAIAFFQTLCSLWRSYYWILTNDASARKLAEGQCFEFVKNESQRLKHVVPDVGALLSSFTALPDRPVGFIDAYLDEAFIRCVMFWKRNGVSPNNSNAVFKATEVSRNIFAFQCLVLREVVGDSVSECAKKMDNSNGQLPEVLDRLQAKWKESRDGNCAAGWNPFFEAVGGTALNNMTVAEWIGHCVQKASERGQAYGGGGGGNNGNWRQGGGGRRGKNNRNNNRRY